MNISIRSINQAISKFLNRYHFVLFVIFAVGGLSSAIFLLNKTVEKSYMDNGYTSPVSSAELDTQTIEKLRNLRAAGEATDKIKISGRTNPFVE